LKIASVHISRVACALLISDAAMATAIFSTAAMLSYDTNLVWLTDLALPKGIYIGIIVWVTVGFILMCNFAMGLYQRRFMRGRRLVRSIIVCALISLVALLFTDNLFLQNSFGFLEIASLLAILYGLIAVSRPLICNFYEKFMPKKRLALIGSPLMAEQLRVAMLGAFPSDAVLVEHYDYEAGTDLSKMLEVARSNTAVDEIFVEMAASALHQHSEASPGRPLTSTLSFFDRYMHWTDNEMVDISQVETMIRQGHAYYWVKRILETLVSLIVMTVLLPVIIGAMIAIKLDDGGALFYKQTRVGKNGKHFSVLKFRSMVENAEKAGTAQWAQLGDSRVTRVGRFLRKSRIDELPQLLNVIKGDMALVGPRPERPEFVEILSNEIANFDLRHAIRPGLTGWAQISYPYGASMEDARWKTRYDLYYICNWTIWLDIAIIMQTIRVVLLAEGSR